MNTSEQARCQAHAHQAHKAVHGHLNKLVADDDEDKTQNTPDTTLCSAEAMKKVEKKIDFFLQLALSSFVQSRAINCGRQGHWLTQWKVL
jgi:hypothetical protein